MLEAAPILVNEKMQVIDGNHRLEAAKQLDLEVYFQVISGADSDTMILLNTAQKKWSFSDYVNFYACQGKKPYLILADLSKKYKLPTSFMARHLCTRLGGNALERVKLGKMDDISDDKVASFIKRMETVLKAKEILMSAPISHIIRYAFNRSCRLLESLLLLVNDDRFNLATLEKKISIRSDKLAVYTTSRAYTAAIKEIYNYRNQEPIE